MVLGTIRAEGFQPRGSAPKSELKWKCYPIIHKESPWETFDRMEAMLDPVAKANTKDELGVFRWVGVLVGFAGLLFVFAVPAIAQQANGPVVEKAKSRPGRVYTDEDLSRLPKDGISIAGQETPSETASSAGKTDPNRHWIVPGNL